MKSKVTDEDVRIHFKPLVDWLSEKLNNNHAKLKAMEDMQTAIMWATKSAHEDEENTNMTTGETKQ